MGEVSFFTDQPRSMRVVSIGFSTCFKISRKKFLSTLNEFSRDRVIFILMIGAIPLSEGLPHF